MKLRFILIITAAFIFQAIKAQIPTDTAKAELITISGVVFAAKDSLGLGGVDVLVKGKSFGSITDELGRFTIRVSDKDSTLIFSQDGKIPLELAIPFDTKYLEVYLEAEPGEIVYPYFSEQTEFFTGSAQVLPKNKIRPGARNSVENVLQGQIAGLHVAQKSGVLTSETFVRLRGIGSVLAGGEPLYIIDGIPIVSGTQADGGGAIGATFGAQTSPIAEMVIEDIESIDVLKDAWATGIYGARAANGVIQIHTKRGRPGKTLFNAGLNFSTLSPTRRLDMMNTSEFLANYQRALENTANRLGTAAPSLQSSLPFLSGTDSLLAGLSAAQGIDTRWLDQVLQTGFQQQFDVSAAGGNKNVTFYFSGAYIKQQGIQRNNDNDRLSVRFNSDIRVSDKLKFGSRIALSLSQTHFGFAGTDTTGGFVAAQTRALPYFPVNNSNPGVALNPYPFNNFFAPYNRSNAALTSDRNFMDNERLVFRTMGAVNGAYEFNKNFSLSADVGFDYFSNFDRVLRSRFMRLGEFVNTQGDTVVGPSSLASDFRLTHFSVNAGAALNYKANIGEKGRLQASAGAFTQRVVTKFNGVSSELFPSDYSRLVSFGSRQSGEPIGAETGFAFANFYTRAMYIHDHKYIAGVNLATTGSTRFGEEVNPALIMPTGTLGWIFTKESFMADASWLSFGKLKASYGVVGNSLIDNEQAIGFWRGNRPYMDPFSYPGLSPFRAPNPNLMFERFRMADVGIETGFFDNKLTAGLTYFNKLNTNVIQSFPLPPSQGLDFPFLVQNGGKIRNAGIELSINSLNLDGDLGWMTNFTIATLNSKVVSLGGLRQDQSAQFIDLTLVEGKPFGSYFLPRWGGLASEDNEAQGWRKGDELLIDRNGNLFRPTSVEQIDSNRVLIDNKHIQPKIFGGISNTFTYGRFELDVFFVYAWGNHVLDEGERISSYISPEQNLRVQRSAPEANLYLSGDRTLGYVDPLSKVNTTRFLHDASYLRLRNVTVAYQIKRADIPRLGLDNMRIYFSLQNFLTFTRFKGWDPESSFNAFGGPLSRNFSTGYTRFDLPQIKSITLGLNVSF